MKFISYIILAVSLLWIGPGLELSQTLKKKSISQSVSRAPAQTCGDFGEASGSADGRGGGIWFAGGQIWLIILLGFIFAPIWWIYALKYFYDFATGECPGKPLFGLDLIGYKGNWSRLEEPGRYGFERDGLFYGAVLSAAITSTSRMGVGIIGEFGKHKIEDVLTGTSNKVESNGTYWMLGPRFYFNWNESNSFTFFDFLAGSSNEDNIGAIGSVRLGLSFGGGKGAGDPGFKIGVFGGMKYLALKERRGIARDLDDWGPIYGLSFGFQI